MSDLFEEDEDLELVEDFDGDDDIFEMHEDSFDARRRLENMLDEKRLLEELDDFLDY